MSEKINIIIAAQTSAAIKGLDRVSKSTQRVGQSVQSAHAKMGSFNKNVTAGNVNLRKFAMGGMQQAGYQVGDFAVQVANGTSKMQAFGQQAPQLLQIFGPIGAVVGAGVAIFAALAVAVQKSGKEVKDMGAVLGQLQEPLSNVVGSLSSLRDMFSGTMSVIVNNIDTALIAAGLFAGYMAVKFVASLAVATAATFTFRGAMYSLGVVTGKVTKLFKRFLPIAILLGVAKLVEMFLQLKKGAGSFGAALGLLGDVFKHWVSSFVMRVELLTQKWNLMVAQFKQKFVDALLVLAERFDGFLSAFADGLNKTFGKTGALQLNIGFSAADQIRDKSQQLQTEIDAVSTAIKLLSSQIDEPNEALARLLDAFKNGAVNVDIFGSSVAGLGDQTVPPLTAAEERIKSIAESIQTNMTSAFMSMVDGTKSVKDAFKDMARAVIAKLYEVLVVQQIVNAAMGALGFSKGPSGDFTKFTNPFGGGGKAIGGPVQKGQSYLVGERGPEMFVPSRSGSIVSNDKMNGGTTVVQNFHFAANGDDSVKKLIAQAAPQIAKMTEKGIIDSRRRGGQFRQVFG